MAARKCVAALKQIRRSYLHENILMFIRQSECKIVKRTCSTYSRDHQDVETEEGNFKEMLRNSQFVKLGRPQGKTVTGRIIEISGLENDDLYVDFGWKFHAVVKRPSSKKGRYCARYSLIHCIKCTNRIEILIINV